MITTQRLRLTTALLVLAVAAAGLWVSGHFAKRLPVAVSDQVRYLSIGYDLATSGRFTDGSLDAQHRDSTHRPSGMFVAPLYPALLAAVMRIDPRLLATARCAAVTGEAAAGCPRDLGLLIPLQFAMAAATLLLLWMSAEAVSGSRLGAWIALVAAAFGCYEYPQHARVAMTETLTCLLFAAFSLALLLSVQRKSLRAAAVAGVLIGLTSLTRPGFLYLAWAITGLVVLSALLLLRRAWREQLRPVVIGGAVLCACCAATVAPWVARNAWTFGIANITHGYGRSSLVQRLAYDAMRLDEYGAGWVYFLPDFGDSLSKAFLPPESYRRLGWDTPDSFYQVGNRDDALESVQAGHDGVGGLILHRVLPDLPKFAAVTVLLAWRGLWIGKYFSVIAFPLFVVTLVRTWPERRWGLLVLSLPALFMLLFHGAVSVSVRRYNLDLIPPFSAAFGMFVVDMARRCRWLVQAEAPS